MASRTTPNHMQPVPGCPPTVQIYKIEASRYWQFRFFVQRKYIRRSTKVTNKAEAIQKAKEFYRDIILKEKQDIAVHPTTFYAVTKQFLDWQMLQVELGRIVKRGHQEDIYKLKSDILPFFQSLEVSSITKATIEEYLNTLTQRRLSKSTLNKHISVIRKILGFAVDRNIINAAPGYPRIGVENNPRPYFDVRSCKLLLRAADHYATNRHVADYILHGKPIRKLRYTEDFADLIDFSVNVFVRISDIKMLRHKHVKIVKDSTGRYLEIFPPDSKSAKASGKPQQSSCSMPQAVSDYEQLKARHEADGFGRMEDFVFYPQYSNRDYTMQVIRRLFTNLLDQLGLRKDEWGNTRTLYSLRHSALMFRLLQGDNIDIFLLAKNALTSVEMLQKFYLSHAESKMRIKELQSFKDKKGRAAFWFRTTSDEELEKMLSKSR